MIIFDFVVAVAHSVVVISRSSFRCYFQQTWDLYVVVVVLADVVLVERKLVDDAVEENLVLLLLMMMMIQ